MIIPLYDKNNNRVIDPNGQEVSIEIKTLVVKNNEYVFGAFDGGKDEKGNYFKVTAKKGTVVNFIVSDKGMYISKNRFLNWLGDRKKSFDNLCLKSDGTSKPEGYQELSGYKKAESDGAKFLQDKWDGSFYKDIGDMSWEDAYNSIEQESLRYYLYNQAILGEKE